MTTILLSGMQDIRDQFELKFATERHTDARDLLWMEINDKFGIRGHKLMSQICLC